MLFTLIGFTLYQFIINNMSMNVTDPRIKELGEAKYREYRMWFNQRLDDAIKAAETGKTSDSYNNQINSSNREL